MIIDLNKFIEEERPYWEELGDLLDQMEGSASYKMDLPDVRRFHYLYQKSSADLARIKSFSAEQDIRRYLESLIARAFAEIHETRRRKRAFSIKSFFFHQFPATFRKHITAFQLSAAIMALGCIFGALAIAFDPDAKTVLMPFAHLQQDPAARVAQEEKGPDPGLEHGKTTFASFLMTHNTRISIFVMGLGITWGIGTLILLFTNGAMLGAVAADYLLAEQAPFLFGWLLPHGAIEIPAIVLAGQAGLILAGAMIGMGPSTGPRPGLKNRLRNVSGDLVTLICGVALLLIWAGIVEGFLSQYHEPVIPYSMKIIFGIIELFALTFFLAKAGRRI